MKCIRWKWISKFVLLLVFTFVLWEILYVVRRSKGSYNGLNTGEVGINEAREVVTEYNSDNPAQRSVNVNDLGELKGHLDEHNAKQYIRNGNRLGLTINDDTIVILIQVHNRLQELNYLIQSLERARHIEKCLVIFSHDHFSEEINTAVRSIFSFPVLQIFYPYSLQLYPDVFPGQSPDDCHKDRLHNQIQMNKNCLNAETPDRYGHFREANVTIMKHHWVWLLHYAIEELNVLQDFTGTFLRLDEDYYLSEDAIQVLIEMRRLNGDNEYPLMVLGDYDDIQTPSFEGIGNMVRRRYWFVGVGRGMAFSRSFWEQLKTCSDVFCTTDDYNWDWSLRETIKHCFSEFLTILQPSVGRVFHIGKCHGFHRNVHDCSVKELVKDIDGVLTENEEHLFPKTMFIQEGLPLELVPQRESLNGGWGDPRDHRLCKSLFSGDKEEVENTIEDINLVAES